MTPLAPGALRWLRLAHALGAAVWVGSGVALSVSQFFLSAADGRELHGKLAALDFIDLKVLVPGAMLCLVTGVVYSAWTPWGWFQHRWITVKWMICAGGIVFGTFWLGPWLSGLVRLSADHGLAALDHPWYRSSLWGGALQVASLIAAVVLTVFRPWRRRRAPAEGGPGAG